MEGFLDNQRLQNTVNVENDCNFFPVGIINIKVATIEKLKEKNIRPKQEGGFEIYLHFTNKPRGIHDI
jgi:hypothetical protein